MFWKLHFTAAGQRITLRGRCRRTLLQQLGRIARFGLTPSAYALYQRNDAGHYYRTSIRRYLAA